MNGNETPLVSVFTPVYNGAAYLRECIESVLTQTYPNWEYVILNNASTDGSLEIATEYAARDARIRVHSNDELLPVVKNHNKAISLACAAARYCKPLMADDWMFPDALQKLVAAATRHSSIGLVCAMAFDGTNVLWDGWPYPAERVSGREVCKPTLEHKLYVFGASSTMMFRADLVRKRKPFFNEAHVHTDVEACFDVLQESDFAYVHQVLSYNRVHAQSVTSAADSVQSIRAVHLYLLYKYGPVYLTPEEFAAQERIELRDYYSMLANEALHFRDAKFWNLHESLIAQAGQTLDPQRLRRAVALRALQSVARHPINVLRSLVFNRRWLKRIRPAGASAPPQRRTPQTSDRTPS